MITLTTPTVLVIEDDEPVRRTLVDILDMNGYRAISAPNGTDGLALALQSRKSTRKITRSIHTIIIADG